MTARNCSVLAHRRASWRQRTASLILSISAAALAAAPAGASAWFWDRVPAKVAAGSRSEALAVIAEARDHGEATFGTPDRAREIFARWGPEIHAAARSARISEALLAALIMVESAGNADAVSPAGAQGLGQLMPGTARALGVRDSFHPTQNLRGAAAYLSDLLDLFGGDLVLALAAYNAGEGAVVRYNGVPPYAETRDYVPKVLSAFASAAALCLRPLGGSPRAECVPDGGA